MIQLLQHLNSKDVLLVTVLNPPPPRSSQLYAEDPCIICHEEMSPEDLCVLECRHSFHGEVRINCSTTVLKFRPAVQS